MAKQSAAVSISGSEEVDAFIASLEHPHKEAIVALRQIILDADSSIGEGIKWNAPSFRTTEYFATFHLRAKKGVMMILHRGAKRRADAADGLAIDDPKGLLRWLDGDRASVAFADAAEVEETCEAFAALIREWIRHV